MHDAKSQQQHSPASGLHQGLEHPAAGKHLLLTLRGCSLDVLGDEQRLQQLVSEAARAAGATVLQLVSHRFEPQGITVLAVLAESHASLHTYPEAGVVFFDCFTCGNSCDPSLCISLLEQGLSATSVEASVVSR